ncbi:MAG: VCBS repeat-containing protein, partial [Planctomycetota bacterium]|nr:VCBS repeat-containing protein [Planctomycetota bacterium]
MANIKGIATKAATKSKVVWKQATVAVAAFLVSATGCDSGGLKGCSQDDKPDSVAVVQGQNHTPSGTNPGEESPSIPNAPHITGPAVFLGQNRIVMTFSEDVVVNSASAADFDLPVAGDTLDNGGVKAGPKSNQVTITLGMKFSLKTRGEFSSEHLSFNDASGIDVSPTLSADAIESVATGVDAVSYQPVDILPGFTEGLSGLGYRFTEAIAVGDLDSDGTLDVVVGKGALYANETYLQKGPQNNPYQLRQTFGNMTDTLDVALGDFDGDGDLDLLEANMWSENRIRFNNGKGVFLSGIQFGGNQSVSTSLGVADFDQDGDLDIVVGNDQGNPNTVWKNDGTGSGNILGSSAVNFLGNRNTKAIAVGDINRDGYPDIIAGNWGEATSIWMNNADQPWTGFSYAGSLPESGKTQDVKLADLDQDGDLDLVVANEEGESNSIWKNDGTGNFGTTEAFTFGENKTYHLAIADLQAEVESDKKTFIASELLGPQTAARSSSVVKIADVARPIVKS